MRQAEGSYRFGMEALLLASYASRQLNAHYSKKQNLKIAELGCACGASLLALALEFPRHQYLGLEASPEHIICARHNKALLGVSNASFITCDIKDICKNMELSSWSRQCQSVIANPPWRQGNETKRTAHQLRNEALWEKEETLNSFFHAARELLRHHGAFHVILAPARLPDFCAMSIKFSMGIRHILPVAPREGENASLLLISCRKESAQQPQIAPPLVLHDKNAQNGFSGMALEFCPWLIKNGIDRVHK